MKFKHGDYVTCEIDGVKIDDAKYEVYEGEVVEVTMAEVEEKFGKKVKVINQ